MPQISRLQSILRKGLGVLGVALVTVPCGLPVVSSQAAAAHRGTDWPTYNNRYDGQRYSPLRLINTSNVASLGVMCSLKIADAGSFQAGPLVIDGTLYVSTGHNTVAMDAATCAERWRSEYTPTAVEATVAHRGVAFLDGRLFRGTGDGKLFALDAATGKSLWAVEVGDPTQGETAASSPIAWKGLVYIGLSGGDFGIKGRMMAFDAKTGREVWRFYTIPTGTQPGAETWTVPTGVVIGGGAMWSSYTLDPAAEELFISAGNPAPDFNADVRGGANLYTNSVVVLNARTGALKWWYQVKSPDAVDQDLGAAPVLYRDKQGRQVVAVAGKDGYAYGIDRGTHRLLFRTAVTTIKNEGQAPTREGIVVCPGVGGGTKYNGPAFDPGLHSLYVPATDWCALLKKADPVYSTGHVYFGGSYEWDKTTGAADGWITALNSDTGEVRWRFRTGTLMSAGLTPTGGGVLFAGDTHGNFLALDSAAGTVLYRKPTGGALAGGVVTYAVGDRQYVAFTSGNLSRSTNEIAGVPTVFVMGLTDATHPGQEIAAVTAADVPTTATVAAVALKPADVKHGKKLYALSCAACHGVDGTNIPGHSLQGIKTRMTPVQLADFIKNPQAPMPKLFPTPFGEQDVLDIAAYAGGL